MGNSRRVFTSESVSEGHPDKLCDQIADAVLDVCLEQDPKCHVACEVFASTGLVLVYGYRFWSGLRFHGSAQHDACTVRRH